MLFPEADLFFQKAKILSHYVGAVLVRYSNVFCWEHKAFNSIYKDLYLSDGIHPNDPGQYLLDQSYQGAILKALSML